MKKLLKLLSLTPQQSTESGEKLIIRLLALHSLLK